MSERPSWDDVWLKMSTVMAARSKCVRAQVGAVIVSKDQRVLSTGYNGPPRGLNVDGRCDTWCPRAMRSGGSPDPLYDDCHTAHAESNAIARADYSEMQESTMYVSSSMCKGCAKIVANSGISRVVFCLSTDDSDAHRLPLKTIEFLENCGISVDAKETN